MNEQHELLRAISEQPNDDILRLAYADWIEEHRAAEPNTEATCEFIRISCGLLKVSAQMPHKAYHWLDANWQRLLPRVLAHHVPWDPGSMIPVHGNPPRPAPSGGPIWTRSGRKIWCKIRLRGDRRGRKANGEQKVYGCSVDLIFWKGFLSSYAMFTDWGQRIIRDDMLLDQPYTAVAHTKAEWAVTT